MVLVAAVCQQAAELLQVGDGVQIAGALLAPKPAVQVAADGGVMAVAGELADVVDVIDDVGQCDLLVRGVPNDPPRLQHPGVECDADHTIALHDGVQLLVPELALVGDQGPAVVVAGEHGAGVAIHGLPECGVRKVREVEDYAQPVHLCEQRLAQWPEAAICRRAARVAPRAIVRRSQDAQPGLPPPRQLGRIGDGVCAFHADHETERWGAVRAGRVGGVPGHPFVHVVVQRWEICYDADVPVLFQCPVVGELPLGDAIALRGRQEIHVGYGIAGTAGQHCGKAECDAPLPQLGECDGILGAALARRATLADADVLHRVQQVSIPLQCVPREVKVSVNYEHRMVSWLLFPWGRQHCRPG